MTSKSQRKENIKTKAWFKGELKTLKPAEKPAPVVDSDEEVEDVDISALPEIALSTEPTTSTSDSIEEHATLYLGHLPFGFEEFQIADFFGQFGTIKRSFISRSQKTGNSRGYGFVEFIYKECAQLAAETMNDYLMFKKRMVCRVVPKLAATRIKWPIPGPKTERSLFSAQRQAAIWYNTENKTKPINKLIEREEKKRKKLQTLGIDYEFDGYTALVNKLKEQKQKEGQESQKKKEGQESQKEVETAKAKQNAEAQEKKEKEVAEKRKREEEELWEKRKQVKAAAEETTRDKKKAAFENERQTKKAKIAAKKH